MKSLNTLNGKKRATRAVLVVLLAVFAVMGAHGYFYKDDTLFLYLGLIHLFFAIDYLKSYAAAFETVEFLDSSMTLAKKRSSASVRYDEIESLAERRNGFVEIERKDGKSLFVHNDIPGGAKTDDPRRTVNILKEEISSRGGRDVSVTRRER